MAGPAKADADHRPRRWRGRLLIAVIAVLLLGIVEAVLRIAGVGADAKPPTRAWLDRLIYEEDPLLLWRLRRNAVLWVEEDGFPRIETNAAGLRAPELPAAPKGAGELRVLCLGDSVTFGLGLAGSDTYPARLAATLRDSLPGRSVTVVNAGIPGHSMVQSVRLLEELRVLDPDFVVIWSGLNDAKLAMGRPDEEISLPSQATAAVLDALRETRIFRTIERSVEQAPAPDVTRSNPDATRRLARAVREMGAADGFVPIFVDGPTLLDAKAGVLEGVLAAAIAADAASVEGSPRCLSLYARTPGGSDVVDRVRVDAGGRVLVLGGTDSPRVTLTVDELRARLAELRRWRSSYRSHAEALPGDRLIPEQAAGEGLPADAFIDSVHLSPEGTEAAARAIATRILELMRAVPGAGTRR